MNAANTETQFRERFKLWNWFLRLTSCHKMSIINADKGTKPNDIFGIWFSFEAFVCGSSTIRNCKQNLFHLYACALDKYCAFALQLMNRHCWRFNFYVLRFVRLNVLHAYQRMRLRFHSSQNCLASRKRTKSWNCSELRDWFKHLFFLLTALSNLYSNLELNLKKLDVVNLSL
jgi:hypothetical protein